MNDRLQWDLGSVT